MSTFLFPLWFTKCQGQTRPREGYMYAHTLVNVRHFIDMYTVIWTLHHCTYRMPLYLIVSNVTLPYCTSLISYCSFSFAHDLLLIAWGAVPIVCCSMPIALFRSNPIATRLAIRILLGCL